MENGVQKMVCEICRLDITYIFGYNEQRIQYREQNIEYGEQYMDSEEYSTEKEQWRIEN